MQLKTCADCNEQKPVTAFYVSDRRRGYLCKYCKPCASARTKARQAGKTAERVAYNRAWRAENPDKVRGHNRRGGQRYRERHPEWWPTYYAANREQRITNAAGWRERNRGRYLTAEAERRLRRRLGLNPAELLLLVESAVPRSLPPELREDACQELVLRVLAGECKATEVAADARRVVKALWGAHGLKFRTVSLDAPLPGDSRMTFGETLVG